MPLPARTLLAATLLIAFPALALAGASPASFNYTPDPGLMTAGKGELEQRVRRGCAVTQARLQNAAESAVTRPCGCYASRRVMRSLDSAELDAYRSTGVFNDTARGKALAAIMLQTPAPDLERAALKPRPLRKRRRSSAPLGGHGTPRGFAASRWRGGPAIRRPGKERRR